MTKGTVIVRQKAEIDCPSCNEGFLYYLWTFPAGTTRKSIEPWTHEQMKEHCIELKEYCTSCAYNSLR